jgi:protein tyrosine kinase
MTDRDARPSPRELGARQLAGYRVLRSLARDEHVEVLLGHRRVAESPDDAGAAEAGAAVHTVAIKVSPGSESDWSAALRQCAALERARGDHVVDLLDLDADDESIRLIFERLPRGDLAALLRIRPRLDAGEAVTVLAPIATALLRMHGAGVAHGRLSARTVLFREDGSPTLIGFSRAELFEPGAPEVVLEQVDAVRRDRAEACALAVAVLGRVDGGRAHAARSLLADVEGCDDELVLPLLASRLFEVAAAVPVRFEADELAADTAPSRWRAIPVDVIGAESQVEPVGATSSGWAAALGRIVPDPLLQRVLDTVERSPAAPVAAAAAAAVTRRWGAWTPNRRRLTLAVVAAAATVGIVTAVVPAGAVATGATDAANTDAANTDAADTDAKPASAPGAPSPSPSAIVDEVEKGDPALRADDPVAAAAVLIATRDHCLSSLSLRCLDGVDETGSSALDDDQAALRAAQQGGELPDPLPDVTNGSQVVLIERLGDSALVRLGGAPSDPSLLVVRSVDGWRIRDVIVAAAMDGTPSDAGGG